jgi:drug/metabolite transporter (DMT)-like permease
VTPVLFLVMAVGGAAAAQTTFKLWAVDERPRRRTLFVGAAALFVLTQGAFFMALRSLNVGTVYMATACTHVLVLVLAHRLLREVIDRRHVTAVTLIIVGLGLYTL